MEKWFERITVERLRIKDNTNKIIQDSVKNKNISWCGWYELCIGTWWGENKIRQEVIPLAPKLKIMKEITWKMDLHPLLLMMKFTLSIYCALEY